LTFRDFSLEFLYFLYTLEKPTKPILNAEEKGSTPSCGRSAGAQVPSLVLGDVMADELIINEVLRDYGASAPDWTLADLSACLHTCAARFNTAFALDIPTPVIVFQRLRSANMGSYKEGRNNIGLYHQITSNLQHGDEPLAVQLAALFRELLRQWQALHGRPSPWHHFNAEFLAKAKSYCLEFDRRGRLATVRPGPFTRLLQEKGVAWTVLRRPRARKAAGGSKMKKWTCGCWSIWAAVPVDLSCRRCGKLLVRAEPGSGRKRPQAV
jgi:hypothetical protein